MSTLTAPVSPSASAPAAPDARVTFQSLVRSEWIVLSSLRGNLIALIVGGLLTILPGLAMAIIFGVDASGDPAAAEWVPPLPYIAMNGSFFAIAFAAVVGTGIYAKEHQTGSLATQRAAAPRPGLTVLAKAVVIFGSIFVAALAAFALSYAGSAAAYATFGLNAEIVSPLFDIALPILGGALFPGLVGVFALGIAALLRSETWTVTLVVVFLFVVPGILFSLPWEWATTTADALLGSTGQTLMGIHAEITGDIIRDLVLTIAWAAVALAAGALVARRRDA